MRKVMLFALMMMLLLTACGGEQEKQEAQELQRQYAEVKAAELEAEVICHYTQEQREYLLRCAYTPERSTVTVVTPEDLAGVSATVAEGKLCLSYDDVSLDAGRRADAASPVTAIPKLMEAAASGYMTEYSTEMLQERECLRLSGDLPEDGDVVYTTWFDRETLIPLQSEIIVDGERIFQVAWTEFTVKETAPAEEKTDQTQNTL